MVFKFSLCPLGKFPISLSFRVLLGKRELIVIPKLPIQGRSKWPIYINICEMS